MPDQLDRAEEEIEADLAESLRHRRKPAPEACGACFYCTEPLPPGQRFCDASCRDLWQDEENHRAMNGHGE